jgi:hypothetical protein
MELLMGKHLEMADFHGFSIARIDSWRANWWNIELAPPTSQWLPYCIVFQSHEMMATGFTLGDCGGFLGASGTSSFYSHLVARKKAAQDVPNILRGWGFPWIFHHNELRSGATPGRWPRDVGGHCVEQAVGVLESGSKTLAQPRWKPSSGCEGCQV